jgi:hypothetical protein
MISHHKHLSAETKVKPHCAKGETKCIKKHLVAGTGLIIPTRNLLMDLRNRTANEDAVDRLLEEMGVPHVKVGYDELYYGNGAEEWMRIFRFLGKGPRENLTRDQVQEAMRHAATHNTHHNVTLGNYEQVRKLLTGTEFESLLH